jgi:hypothetical protein
MCFKHSKQEPWFGKLPTIQLSTLSILSILSMLSTLSTLSTLYILSILSILSMLLLIDFITGVFQASCRLQLRFMPPCFV